MSDIAFIVDELSDKNGLDSLFHGLAKSYKVSQTDHRRLKKERPRLVITNQATHLSSFVKDYPTIFIATRADAYPFLNIAVSVRRLLLPSLKLLTSIFVYSDSISQQIFRTLKVKATVIKGGNMKEMERKIRDIMENSRLRLSPTQQKKEVDARLKQLSQARANKNLDDTTRRKLKRIPMSKRETLQQREQRAMRVAKRMKNKRDYTLAKEAAESAAKHKKESANPNYYILKTPSWFNNDKDVDVSIIVPLFRSRKVIEKQILTWDFSDDGLTKEIIYVDDHCPQESFEIIEPSWSKQRQHLAGKSVGKVIVCGANRGYGEACNLGAKHANGKYLIFLNADVYTSPDWIRPMYDLLEGDSQIGIVGNLQIQNNKKDAMLIDSAGSSFKWQGGDKGNFTHIGRNIYKGKYLPKPMSVKNMPDDLSVGSEREMVTGCCFMIPKQVFCEAEGFNEAYRIAYWEDSDLNLTVRQLGYKVFFQPKSTVYHVGGHSKGGGHQFTNHNRKYFRWRWIESGNIDDMVNATRPQPPPRKNLRTLVDGTVVGCAIVCNEEEFLEASIESIAPIAERFHIVVGGNEYARTVGMCDDKGKPTDSTLDIAHALAERYPVEVIEPPGRPWKNKTEMRNAYAQKLKHGDWMFMVDGDEVYKETQLWQVARLMQTYEALNLQYYLFWNDLDTLGTGAWSNYPQQRVVKWREGYHYKHPNHLGVSDKDGKNIINRVPTYNGKDKLFYHYAYVRPLKKIRQKIAYYELQLKHEWGKKNDITKNYFENVFLQWRKDRTSVTAGTHPRGGGGTCPFRGIHPRCVTRLIESGKLDFTK